MCLTNKYLYNRYCVEIDIAIAVNRNPYIYTFVLITIIVQGIINNYIIIEIII